MSLVARGISYMVDETSPDVAREDLRAIRERLHCTAVILIGMDIPKMMAAARFALEIGLDVWVEPHPVDISYERVLSNLAATAAETEQLRLAYPGRVSLIVGCEFSIHLAGMIPGRPELVRLLLTMRWRRWFRQRINRKINVLLARALLTVRSVFGGPVTYASASWEEVDWRGFDYAGVNLYRTANNSATFEARLRQLQRRAGKPVVITEFGCGAYVGGAQRGPGSFKIVNWLSSPPRVKRGTIRNERVQAAYVGNLINFWDQHGVHGCFVYTFALREYPHRADSPAHDLDTAAFGVVKVAADDRDSWEPKESFHEIARQYAALARRDEAAPGRVARQAERQ